MIETSDSREAPHGARPTVGIVGLGIMGTSYARLLVEAGHRVVGYDVAAANLARFADLGGVVAASPAAVARAAAIVLTALPSEAALLDVCLGADGLIEGAAPTTVIAEHSTLSEAAKEHCRAALAERGAVLLDCPVSGTGAQAARGDLDILASGPEAAVDRLRPVFGAFAKTVHYVGPFGAGMKIKLIANLLVTIHNVAAAEALLLADRAGLDLNRVYEAVRTGAGMSRMFDVRGPLMIEDRYQPATARMVVHRKDINLIAAFADSVNAPTPLFSAATPFYSGALAQGRAEDDTAAVFAVLRALTEPD